MSQSIGDSTDLHLELESDPNILPNVREQLKVWTRAHGWTDEQTGEIILAVDEALCNVIRHGYDSQGAQKILLTARIIQEPKHGEGLEIHIRDFGKQIDPAKIRGRDLDNIRPGGLGVHIIRAMMSSAEYSRADGGGMLLVMRKYKSHVVDCGKPLGKTK